MDANAEEGLSMSTVTCANELQDVQVEPNERTNRWTSGPAIVLYLAAFKFLLQLLVARRYGYFQDELYFLACSEHLDWGYVEHPPLIIFITKAIRMLIGDSLLSLRLLPAVAGAALVWLTGAITRTLGGGRFAQALAALGVIAVPMYLTFHYILSMNAFEPLFWTGLAYLVLLAAKNKTPQRLIWAGVLIGFGLLNKYSLAVFAAALGLGLVFTPHRKLLMDKRLWLGLAIGFFIFAPHLNWLMVYHFPFLEWQQNIHNVKPSPLIQLSAWEAMLQQVFLTGMASLVWLSGVVFFFCTSRGKPYRFLGWAFVITLGFFIATGAKNYYPIPAYGIVIAGGAVALELWTSENGRSRSRAILVTTMIAGTVLLAPMFIPLLPIDSLLRYQKAIGLHPPQQETAMLSSPLSVYLVGQFGWETLTSKVARVYDHLPAEERRRAAIITRTYPPAAAIDFFGTQYGLPKAISGHLGYYLWGPGNNTSDVVILVGYHFEEVAPACREAEVSAQMYDPYAYPAEMNKPIVVCRGLKFDLQDQWSRLKLWY